MSNVPERARTVVVTLLLGTLAGCAGGPLSEILGGAGAPPATQPSRAPEGARGQGIVRSVDSRSQQIGLQLTNGQNLALLYDNQTKVVYQNQLYAVGNLEAGDEVVVRVRNTSTGSYYTDSVHVTRSVTSSGSTTETGNVQALQGTVRQVDRTNASFILETGNNVMLTVSMPANATRADIKKYESLRVRDGVRIYGVFVTNTRVELRQFY